MTQENYRRRDSTSEDWPQADEATFSDADPVAPLSNSELERRYDLGTARIVTQRNDFLLPNLLDSMDREMYINLNPPYQRRLRWDRKRKSKLIESLLMNVPIPPVFLYETDLAKYEVMDGQQRLSTIREFFGNEFALAGLEEWPQLNGRRYGQLPPRIQSGLQRRSLSAIIVLSESAGDIKRFVFERLNTGGVQLNAQEIRNAIYSGAFNDLLHELSRSDLFTSILEIPPREPNESKSASERLARNLFYRLMLDCEIVLRFFALSEPERLSTSMKKSLDDTMARHRHANNIDVMRADFEECLGAAHAIFGEATFRLPLPRGRRRRPFSRALYDAVMLGLLLARREQAADWPEARNRLVEHREQVIAATDAILADETSYALLVGRLNTKASILERIRLMAEVFDRTLD